MQFLDCLRCWYDGLPKALLKLVVIFLEPFCVIWVEVLEWSLFVGDGLMWLYRSSWWSFWSHHRTIGSVWEQWGSHPPLIVLRWWQWLHKCVDTAVRADSNFHSNIWIYATAFAAREYHASDMQRLGTTNDGEYDVTLFTFFKDWSCLSPKLRGGKVTVCTVFPNKN